MEKTTMSSVLTGKMKLGLELTCRNVAAWSAMSEAMLKWLPDVDVCVQSLISDMNGAINSPLPGMQTPADWVAQVQASNRRISGGLNMLTESSMRALAAGGTVLQARSDAMLEEIAELYSTPIGKE
jgi:hypothetical protein